MTGGEPIATVVIVTWNGAHLLGACLDALERQSLGLDRFRTIVVDNASVDGTTELLAHYPWVRIVYSERNLGFAGGATLGLRNIRTPFAAVLNNDAVPDDGWLEGLLAGFRDGVVAVTSKVLLQPRFVRIGVADQAPWSGETGLGVRVDGVDVTGALLLPTRSGADLLVPLPDLATGTVTVQGSAGDLLYLSLPGNGARGTPSVTLAITPTTPRVDVVNSAGGSLTRTGHGADRGYLEIDVGQYDDDADVFSICGAAAAFRTREASSLGWFDPWFFAYYEDLDLSWRLRRRGGTIRYVAGAVVRHQHAATSRVGSDMFLLHNYRNRLATLAGNATGREIVQFAGELLRPTDTQQRSAGLVLGPSRAPDERRRRRRLRLQALFSFAAHLPHIMARRVRERLMVGSNDA